MRNLNDSFSLPRFLYMAACIAMLVACWPFALHAANATAPQMDASCTNMNQYGFTVGLVYCVQTSIGNAVTQYITTLQQDLSGYEAGAFALALALFGFKMMNSNLQEPLKESMTFLVKIMIGVFFFSKAQLVYNDIAGTSNGAGTGNGIMNQAIGWVTGTGGDTTLFSNLISSNCTAPTPPANFEGYQIWQGIDCMFSKMIGAANPADHPYAFGTSLAVVAAASLLSGTLGVIISMLALQAIIGAFLMILRAIYLVLLAYLTIGFLAIFCPLIAPLLFFESSFLTEKFKRWVSLLVSTIFQPVFVLGFLAMAVTVADQLMEGTISGCTPPTYPNISSQNAGSGTNAPPKQGWGQDGSGVCSFAQLFNHDVNASSSSTVLSDSSSGAVIAAAFQSFMEQNATMANWSTLGDPQEVGVPNNYQRIDTNFGDNYAHNNKTNTTNAAQQFASLSSNNAFSGITRVKQYLPLKQLTVTLLTFIFVVFTMKKLMNEVPQMADSLAIFVGTGLTRMIETPVEGMVNSAFSGAKSAMLKNAQGQGILPGNAGGASGLGSMISAPLAGVRGAINGVTNHIYRND